MSKAFFVGERSQVGAMVIVKKETERTTGVGGGKRNGRSYIRKRGIQLFEVIQVYFD